MLSSAGRAAIAQLLSTQIQLNWQRRRLDKLTNERRLRAFPWLRRSEADAGDSNDNR